MHQILVENSRNSLPKNSKSSLSYPSKESSGKSQPSVLNRITNRIDFVLKQSSQ